MKPSQNEIWTCFSVLLVAILVSCFLFSSCEPAYRKLGIKDDNAIEEIAESVIDQKTGLDIDLTPSSSEN